MRKLLFFLLTVHVLVLNAAEYQYFNSNGVDIAYRSFGSGEPLIVLNGGPGRSSDSFTELAQKLSLYQRQIILFDQRGTGRSKLKALDDTTVHIDLMVEDLENLRKHLGQNQIAILGHSFGGMYAMSYAARYPSRIKLLILSASGGVDLSWQSYALHNMLSRLSQEARDRYDFWNSPEQVEKDPIQATLEALRVLVPAYVYHQKYVPVVEKALVNLDYYTPKINGLVWQSMQNYNLTGAFKGFGAPALILAGRQDILGEAVPIAIQREFSNSQLEWLDECSHYPWLDSPDRYFQLIDDFLKSH